MNIRHVLSVVVALLAGAAEASAQAQFVYAFNQRGQVGANAYPLDNLPHEGTSSDQSWRDLFVRGPDRWLIRGDGVVVRNGAKVVDLGGDDGWRGIVVDDADAFFALRNGGRVSSTGGIVAEYSAGSFFFTDIETDGEAIYVLKSNGAVFRVPEPDPIVKFNGSGTDGDSTVEAWVRLIINPVDGHLWALRHDGRIRSAAVPVTPADPPDEGTAEASLPSDSNSDDLEDELYHDFTFDDDGTWYALRADGRLFSTTHQGPALVNFPSAPSDKAKSRYESVAALAGQTFVLRQDGLVFKNEVTEAIANLRNGYYVQLVLGVEFPDLENVKQQRPVATSMTVVAPLGADIELPVVATDRDMASADLLVDAVTETLPAGASWDAGTRTISWPAAGPVGKYKIKVTASDGVSKPVTATQTITIKPLDANGSKNTKPSIVGVKNAVALVAVPFELPILGFDLDGTVPVLSLNPSGKQPPAGTTFDALTGILTWDAAVVANLGTVGFRFLATDGMATTSRSIKAKVKTSLLGF